jgi:hypothetical protein
MENVRQNATTGVGALGRSIGGVVFLVIAAVILYYLYQYLYGTQGLRATTILTNPIQGNVPTEPSLYTIPPVYEGGEYSVTFWVYVTAYKDQTGKAKHIMEIRGVDSSTLVVGLDAFTNKLMVRVNTNETVTPGTTGSNPVHNPALTTSYVASLFQNVQAASGLLAQELPMCDLPEIELQRWVCLGIVLNGRTVDVYLDGRLARSCVLNAVFSVDPKGMKMKLLDFNGFSGFLGDVVVYNYSLSPDQVYRIYMQGPTAVTGGGILNWLANFFNVKGTLTYSYPAPAVTYPTATVTF